MTPTVEEIEERDRIVQEIRAEVIKSTKRAFNYWQRRWLTTNDKEMIKNWTRFYGYLKLEIGE